MESQALGSDSAPKNKRPKLNISFIGISCQYLSCVADPSNAAHTLLSDCQKCNRRTCRVAMWVEGMSCYVQLKIKFDKIVIR